MNTGGTQNVRQTSTVELNKDQQALLDLAMPGLKNFAAHPPQLPPYSRVAGFDPLQTAGQQQVLDATGGQQSVVSGAAGANNFLTNPDIVNPNSNPALAGAIDAAVRPISEQLTTSTLPAIRGEAIANGQYGGSRQGIAEGLASRSASQAIADTSSKMANEGYLAGLDALTKGVTLAPTTAASLTTPGLTTSGVGDVRQGMAQQKLSEQAGDFNYNQVLPYLLGSDLVSLVSGIPGGTTVATGNGPSNNLVSSALGGLTLGGTIGPLLGLTGPVGAAAGAGITGLLSLMGI